MKHFQAIAAMSLNRVIGQGNKIPWHLPEDFKFFKKKTIGNIVVMGRRTFESLGKPLPQRKNLVLTRHPRRLIGEHPELFAGAREWRGGQTLKLPFQFDFSKLPGSAKTEVRLINSLEGLVASDFPSEIFICGGAQVYEQALPRCSDLYLTLVKREVEGDAFFPSFETQFVAVEEVMDCVEFKITHYQHRSLVRE